jgi:hypothetical protein
MWMGVLRGRISGRSRDAGLRGAWGSGVNVDVAGALSALAVHRRVFHSERDFQHALAWQIQLASLRAQIRLETRLRRGVHLDLLVVLDGMRTAVELKYLVAALHADVGGEPFNLPHQSANDISPHDVVKDIVGVETALADGYADCGCVLLLSNDRSYWQPPARADCIDAAFRLHEGRILAGTLAWAARAGAGTTKGRDTPLQLAGRYTCHWHDYSQVSLPHGRTAVFRYLLITATASPDNSPRVSDAGTGNKPSPAGPPTDLPQPPQASHPPGSARQEILTAARKLASRSPDGSFTLEQVIAELRRADTRYAESTIRTHVTSRMCADSPDYHGTTYDDLERLDRGRYRLRQT